MGQDGDAPPHKAFAYLHGLPVPLEEVWSWLAADRPVDVTVVRDETDCAAQAARREARLHLQHRLEEVGALFGVDDRHAHRRRDHRAPPPKPWFERRGPSAAATSELEYARVAQLPRDVRDKAEARKTWADRRVRRREQACQARSISQTVDKLAKPVRQRPPVDVRPLPRLPPPFCPSSGDTIEWVRRPAAAWTTRAPPRVEAPPLSPAEKEDRAARAAAQRAAAARMASPRAPKPRTPSLTKKRAPVARAEPYPDDFQQRAGPPENDVAAQAPAPEPPSDPLACESYGDDFAVAAAPETESAAAASDPKGIVGAPAPAPEPKLSRPPSPTPSDPLATAEPSPSDPLVTAEPSPSDPLATAEPSPSDPLATPEPSYACESYARAPEPSQDSYAADFTSEPAPPPSPPSEPSRELDPEPLESEPEHGLQPRPSQVSYGSYSSDFAGSAPASALASAPASAPRTPPVSPGGFFDAPGSAEAPREPSPEPSPDPEPESDPARIPAPTIYWLARREAEGDDVAPTSTHSPGRGLVSVLA